MRVADPIYMATRQEWRDWLENNHASAPEIWLYIRKKGSTCPSILLPEAVEEALCFGWIDGVMKSIDDEKFALRFSHRRRGSHWSDANKRRVRDLMARGLMTEAGLGSITFPLDEDSSALARQRREEELPGELQQILMQNETAWRNFNGLPPSARKLYVAWIMQAKREETRRKRLQEAMGLLERNERLGMR